MSRDTLSDVLRAVRLRGAVFYYVDGSSPWVAETAPARELIPAIMPAVEHLIEFHAVAEGDCWGAILGEPAVRLQAGDVILFPQGDAHVMSSAPGMRSPETAKAFMFTPPPPQLPSVISVRGSEVTTARLDGGGRDRATVVCGFLGLDARPFNPLLAALPRVLHVAGATLGPDSWVAAFLRTAVVESSQKRPGGEAVLERMSEMLFVEVLRRHIDGLPSGHGGWLGGMRDPAVGHVLGLLHERPEDPWTLERLAEDAALSRSTLHERFVQLIGQPPMQYLAQWRMQVAAQRLRDTNAKILEIALAVGYESEAAFCRAFKRTVGVTPGAWRAGRRPG
ncbi:MAG TPA: AraC family transcriptional regulator [Methylomirabilota bacterium]|nr:AraC family transcriptional regulator [Methylomirabilota bacterium]